MRKPLRFLHIPTVLAAGLFLSCSPRSLSDPNPARQAVPLPSQQEMETLLLEQLTALGKDPDRQVLGAPAGAANMVFAFSAHVEDPDGPGPLLPQAVELIWYEVNAGDYNMDSLINISDLTPLGINFNQTVLYDDPLLHNGLDMFPQGNPLDDGGVLPSDPPAPGSGAANWRRARVDGNSDGLINISDITTIAQHWQQQLTGYRVYRRRQGETELSMLPNLTIPASPMSLERSQLSFDVLRPVRYSYTDSDLGPASGIYDYVVRPYDVSSAAEGTESIALHVDLDSGSGGINPPVAVLGSSVSGGAVPLTVDFDASASYDPDALGVIVRYEWDTNNDHSTYELDSGSVPSYQANYLLPGNYEQWVRVTDGDGMTGETFASIAATSDNAVPVAMLLATPDTGTAPLTVELNAGASHDPDGSLVSFEFDPEGDGSYLPPTSVIVLNHNYPWAGTYQPQVRVTDDEGATDTANTTVVLDGLPVQHDPVAHLTASPQTGEAPLVVILDASGSTDEDSDITAYLWDLDGNGSFETSGGATPTYSHTFTDVGNQTVSVQVRDSRNASDTASTGIDVLPGAMFWHTYPADNTTSGTKSSVSLIEAGSVPALAYFDKLGQDVIYVRAENSLGTAWKTPFQIASNLSEWGGDVDLAVVNGKPAVSYKWSLNAYHGYVCYKRSDDTQGDLWLSTIIAAGISPSIDSTSCSLADIGGRPAMSFLDLTTGNLYYMRANDANGDVWPALKTVMAGDNAGRNGCLLYVNSRPAVAHIQQYNAATVFYQRAGDATGIDWSGPGSISESFVGNGYGGTECSIAIVNGNPAICFYDKNGQDLRFHRALNDDGSAWGAEQILDDTSRAGRYCAMAQADGRAFIVYFVESTTELLAIHAEDAEATLWSEPELIEAVSTSFPDAAEVDGKAAAAYIRGNAVSFAVRY